MRKHPDADVMVSFASLRSAYDSTIECLEYPQIRTIAIIAEGIPENMTRKIIKLSAAKGVNIIGIEKEIFTGHLCFKLIVVLFDLARTCYRGRRETRLLQDWKYRRNDGQHPPLQAVQAGIRGLRVQVRRNEQRAEQHHFPPD